MAVYTVVTTPKLVSALVPGDKIRRVSAQVVKVTQTAKQVTIETDDGRVEIFDLAGSPAVEVI